MSNYYEPVRASDELAQLRKRQEALMKRLEDGFDQDIYRNLNLINHKIEVVKSRQRGEWEKGSHPATTTVPGHLKVKNFD